jgi:nitrogenase molybdenum-iron protein NifN
MAEILKRSKPLSVSPLKASAPVGAALAFLGIRRAIPMLHGSQGCTAFAKVFFVRHFREPIPLQTTAMDQMSTVMSADENVIEGLATICGKSRPALIGLPTTGLSETQGTDILRLVREFRARHPEFAAIPVVPVSTPDYNGCLESGYADALKAIIDVLVPADRTRAGRRHRQVNVLAGSLLTPGDIEHVKDLVEAFGLRPVVVPDIADSLDGHLTPEDFSPLTLGGTPVSEVATLGEARATLVVGRSLAAAADLLKERSGVPDYRFDSLMGLDAVDAFVAALAQIADAPVPEKIERQRAQLQDAMVDTHFMFGFARVAIAADPDLLYGLSQLVRGMGGETVAAVAPARAAVLEDVAASRVQIGDLEDLEIAARAGAAQVVIGSSHAVPCARRLGLPVLRAGFPQYDHVGGYQKTWVGYRGTRQTLFDLANLVLEHHGQHEIRPFRSRYATKGDVTATAAAAAAGGSAH